MTQETVTQVRIKAPAKDAPPEEWEAYGRAMFEAKASRKAKGQSKREAIKALKKLHGPEFEDLIKKALAGEDLTKLTPKAKDKGKEAPKS